MNDFDAVDVGAAETLPAFDDSLLPDVLGYLGFDVTAQGVPAPARAPADPQDDDEDEMNAKRPYVWANQREVQKRYRERKKNQAKSLEGKVATLEAKLLEMKALVEAAQEKAVPRHLSVGSIADGICAGTDNTRGENDRGAGLDFPPAERQNNFRSTSFGELVKQLRVQLNRGAADADIRRTLQETLKVLRVEDASSVLEEHAEVLNNARGGRPLERIIPSETRSGGGGGEGGGGGGGQAGGDGKVILSHDGKSVYHGSKVYCGLDGTVMTVEEARKHCIKISDTLLSSTAPAEVEVLVEWRDEYVERLCNIYLKRQDLGLLIASSAGAVIMDHHQRDRPENMPVTEKAPHAGYGEATTAIAVVPLVAPPESSSFERRPGVSSPRATDGQCSTSSPSSCNAEGSTCVAFAATGDENEKIVEPEPNRGGRRDVTHLQRGGNVSSAMKALNELKLSVQSELNVRKEMICDLVNRRLQPRTVARLMVLSLPMFPDPLAVALELKLRRGLSRGRAIVS